MLRKVAIGVGALLVLTAVVAIALVALVDVNRFKPDIARVVADRYQRTLSIDGDLGLTLFPRLAITLPATTLSERGRPEVMARIASARVAVAVMPLLQRRLVADRVVLDGLDAKIERSKDGQLSIADLIGTAPPGSAGKPDGSSSDVSSVSGAGSPSSGARAGGPGGRLQDLELGGVQITRAQLLFDDRKTGNRIGLSNLSLETGAIATGVQTPITLAFAATATKPVAAFNVTLNARALAVPTAAGQSGPGSLTLSDLDLQLRGTLDGRATEVRTTAPQIRLAGESLAAEKLALVLRTGGPATGGAGGPPAGSAVDAAMTATLTVPLAADLAAGRWRLAPIEGTVVVDHAGTPGKAVKASMKGTAEIDTARETIATELSVKLDDATVDVKAGVRGFERPKTTLALNADRLDLDRWLPPPSQDRRAAPATASTSGSAAGSTPASSPVPMPAPAPAPAAATTRTPSAGSPEGTIDLRLLDALDLTGRIRIGELRGRGLVATQLAVDLQAAQGQLTAAPISATLYQGRLSGQASVRSAGNATRAELQASGLSIAPLLAALSGRDLLEGRGDLRLALGTSGPTAEAMLRALDGTVALQLSDGAIRGINLAETVRSARNLLRGNTNQEQRSDRSQKTDFTSLSVSFAIQDGVATSNDLDVRSPLLRLGGDGRVDLPADRLHYTVRASVVGTSTGQGGKELDELRGVTIPVQLSGPIAAPTWQIDWVSAGRDALKSRAASELKERLKTDPRVEELKDRARERLGGSLRDLFKR